MQILVCYFVPPLIWLFNAFDDKTETTTSCNNNNNNNNKGDDD